VWPHLIDLNVFFLLPLMVPPIHDFCSISGLTSKKVIVLCFF
jgi:hypothetical protein